MRTPTSTPFSQFHTPSSWGQTPLRQAITHAYRRPEQLAVQDLLAANQLPQALADATRDLAHQLVHGLRNRKSDKGRAGLVQDLLQEYTLSSEEGIALMCLAEALLRIPDTATRDALIQDKIAPGAWKEHLGQSSSVFVNAATWGLVLTGKLLSTTQTEGLSSTLTQLIRKGGAPLIRASVDRAMRMMGTQFVTGETIDAALQHSAPFERQGFRYSYDMLGEAAMTAEDAKSYLASYEMAIHAIGKASAGRGIYEGPGISIKLSALHPRYSVAQTERVHAELYPVVLQLCALAKQYNIGLNIDAEEADRLELSLDLLEQLCFAPELAGWQGIGFVIQAYQKRCPWVIDYLVDLAQRSQRRLMVRLVKGAYWDSEIKRAQLDGLPDYPVYTRKVHTDASYIACARKLLAAPAQIYPQFATHNAQTLATIYHLADPQRYHAGQYEFQCLHGMGESLYEQVVGPMGRPCRIYAPVGTHETLLAYLVRRLLENGANTSFVNRIADHSIAIETLVQSPWETLSAEATHATEMGRPNPAIPLAPALYGPQRSNSRGLDLSNADALLALHEELVQSTATTWHAHPLLATDVDLGQALPVRNPAQHSDTVGLCRGASAEEIEAALSSADTATTSWQNTPAATRSQLLQKAADELEAHMPQLLGLLMREAGKTASNAIAEVREAVDFLRFYALQAEQQLDTSDYPALGVVACISPWNFPLAIFLGQVSAALAAGNTVVAKPAEQTPLIAAFAVQLLWRAGVPRDVLQLLPGDGAQVGAPLVNDSRVQGVLFTGSTEVARILQRTLAKRTSKRGHPIPLVAETGGQNALIVDSSALVEQVIADVVVSGFDSAGQRCSALRVLCVQEEIADRVQTMLLGAMQELQIGRPTALVTDVGPVIDQEAQHNILQHLERMRSLGLRVHQAGRHDSASLQEGTFVLPTLIEIQHLNQLEREVFGPVVHLLRYRREALPELLQQIQATGYGLTMGLHTRIDSTTQQVLKQAPAGNVYVNRNIVGAVVGVQPFGGEGLSGTGPKAGGPLYLLRLLAQTPDHSVQHALRAVQASSHCATQLPKAAQQLLQATQTSSPQLGRLAQRWMQDMPAALPIELRGPTGESNTYRLQGREHVLCLAPTERDLHVQLLACFMLGSHAVVAGPIGKSVYASLPSVLQQHLTLANDWKSPSTHYDAALLHGTHTDLLNLQSFLAQRPGAIVPISYTHDEASTLQWQRLLKETSISINTAAAGGNASLMTLQA